MKKLIVISAALASVTLLSGCKTMVVHRVYEPAVVVDSRHHHEDVHVIHHADPRVRHYDYRQLPPQYREKVIVQQKKVVVVNPPAHGHRVDPPQRTPKPSDSMRVKYRVEPVGQEHRREDGRKPETRRHEVRRHDREQHRESPRSQPKARHKEQRQQEHRKEQRQAKNKEGGQKPHRDERKDDQRKKEKSGERRTERFM